MKKKYMNPEMEIVNIKIQQHFLAGSEIPMGEGDKDPVTDSDAPEMGDLDFDF